MGNELVEGILYDIVVDSDLTVSDVRSEDIGLETTGLNFIEVNWLVGGLKGRGVMVLEAGFVLRTYLVETITETMGSAVETGEADTANLVGIISALIVGISIQALGRYLDF